MSANQPAPSSNNTVKIILTVVIVIVVVCFAICCILFLLPMILGPQISNIFSKVTSGLTGTFY